MMMDTSMKMVVREISLIAFIFVKCKDQQKVNGSATLRNRNGFPAAKIAQT